MIYSHNGTPTVKRTTEFRQQHAGISKTLWAKKKPHATKFHLYEDWEQVKLIHGEETGGEEKEGIPKGLCG